MSNLVTKSFLIIVFLCVSFSAFVSAATTASGENTTDLASIRLEKDLPPVGAFPAFGTLKWASLNDTLTANRVNEKANRVFSGFTYIGYTQPRNPLKELEADVKKGEKERERQLADLRKLSPAELKVMGLKWGAVLLVRGGIKYREDGEQWIERIKKRDPQFEGAGSAGVGDHSLLSPFIRDMSYNVRFTRGNYGVSLYVDWGSRRSEFKELLKNGLTLQAIGTRIARLFDDAIRGDVPGIALETNPETGAPYIGLVTDGTNTLDIVINLPDAVGDLQVSKPKSGLLLEKNGNKWQSLPTESISLGQDGKGRLRYSPRAYIMGEELTDTMRIHPKDEPDVWYAEERLTFRYRNDQGEDVDLSLPIRVFRPPVVLIHGFTGGLATWEWLDMKLTDGKWDTQRGEYYLGSQGIAEQSVLLRGNIQVLKAHYLKKNVKMAKVDLVGHSMGGLISRYYISLSGRYENDVRKLIMVGTPNHGCSFTEKILGKLQSLSGFMEHLKASHDLYENSPFMIRLNNLEATGGHLHPDVQYAILFGQRHNYWIWGAKAAESYYPNDGVVSVDSALLNGVKAYRFNGTLHTSALKSVYPEDKGICNILPVAEKIKALLLHDIPRVDLADSDALLKKVKGKVEVFQTSWKAGSAGISVRRKGVRTGHDSMGEINFVQHGGLFAKLVLAADTEIRVFYSSLRFVRVYIYRGHARLIAPKVEKGSVELVAGKGSNELQFYPTAHIIHLDTDLEVAVSGDDVHIFSRDGRVLVEHWDQDGQQLNTELAGGEGILLVGGTKAVKKDKPPVPLIESSETGDLPAFPGVQTGGEAEPPVPNEGLGEDITSGLVLAYDFTRKPINNTVEDLSGSRYQGRVHGPVWTKDKGLYFDGQDDYVEVKGGGKSALGFRPDCHW